MRTATAITAPPRQPDRTGPTDCDEFEAESGAAIATLAIDPARPATIWAVAMDWTPRDTFFVIRSSDRGRTWATAPRHP